VCKFAAGGRITAALAYPFNVLREARH
jgi:hypothetical protein